MGNQIGVAGLARRLIRALEYQRPKVVPGLPRLKRGAALYGGDVAPDSMALVAVDAALALHKVDRIARQVPVHQAMAPGMKIQPLLPDRGAGEHEGPERAVERGANHVLADVLVVLRAQMAEAKGEHRADANLLRFDVIGGRELREIGREPAISRVAPR